LIFIIGVVAVEMVVGTTKVVLESEQVTVMMHGTGTAGGEGEHGAVFSPCKVVCSLWRCEFYVILSVRDAVGGWLVS
jgi:hypothetical protein